MPAQCRRGQREGDGNFPGAAGLLLVVLALFGFSMATLDVAMNAEASAVEEALERFRTIPPQEHYLDFVIDHVARHSGFGTGEQRELRELNADDASDDESSET